MTPDPTPTLDALRAGIDTLDERVLALLNERAALATQVGKVKNAVSPDAPFHVPRREQAIVERLEALNPGPFPTRAIKLVFQEVFSACLSLEKGLKVAFLGPEGTFSHAALKHHFGLSAKAMPCPTVGEVFRTVESGEADFGIVPVENATEGMVDPTFQGFVGTGLSISAEILLPVEHCLAMRPGGEQSLVQRVYSHPIVFGQCRRWLATNLPDVAWVEAPSTAEAARLAREDVHGAAIASELAASLHGLDVLRKAIQDLAQNATRFFVLGRQDTDPTGRDRTSILLTLKDGSGALLKVLEPLAQRGINLCRIESRPRRESAWDYAFFLDLEGHQKDATVAEALAELKAITASLKILGSYPTAFVEKQA